MSAKRFIDVAAGLLIKPDGQLLLGQRPDPKQWAGWWELPGGKLEPGETPAQALQRELQEELGITVTKARPWVTYTHEYPTTIVRLAFFIVTAWDGEPRGAEGQAVAWIRSYAQPELSPLLPATRPPLRWLSLPDRYLLTSIDSADRLPAFLGQLQHALQSGVRMVQFREPAWACRDGQQLQLRDAFLQVLDMCRRHKAWCLVNSVHPREWWLEADGVHFRAADARAALASKDPLLAVSDSDTTQEHSGDADGEAGMTEQAASSHDTGKPVALRPGARRGTYYVAISTHCPEELALARALQADFAVLGHVLDTASHPDTPAMGWQRFQSLNSQAGLPVLALGGQSAATLDTAQEHGAHGVAGMRALLARP